MRGKVFGRVRCYRAVGITPAYAGKRTSSRPTVVQLRDHPRVCGEKNCGSKLAFRTIGSPPRVRGKAEAFKALLVAAGITPACAGKSRSVQGPAGSCGDHPRVCGEKSLKGVTLTAPAGSPPRVRGKVVDRFSYAVAFGITPAYAGKSCWCFCWSAGCWDHPRVCGEKFWFTFVVNYSQGSPPRVRGKGRFHSSG